MDGMTPLQWATDLRTKAAKLRTSNAPLRIAAFSALALASKRIFEQGLNSAGSKIGDYATAPGMYVNPATSPGNTSRLKPPTGKTGRTHFESGKRKGQPHKTTFVDSYKAYKQAIGQPSNTVIPQLSSRLKFDFENSEGGTPTPRKVSEQEYEVRLRDPDSPGKVAGLESKYGKIFAHTSEEVKQFFRIARLELLNFLQKPAA